jgi:hypothetical protein
MLTGWQVQQGALAGIKKKKAQTGKNKERWDNFGVPFIFSPICAHFICQARQETRSCFKEKAKSLEEVKYSAFPRCSCVSVAIAVALRIVDRDCPMSVRIACSELNRANIGRGCGSAAGG